MNIGQRLRSLRKSKGLSLGDVQERTGMHGSHLSRVETGRIVPSLETLQRWAWALDAELYQFFLEDGQNLPPGAINHGAMRSLGSREERLLDLFGRMDVRNQDLILSLAESVDRHLPKAVGHRVRKPGQRPGAFSAGSRGFSKVAARTASNVDAEILAGENR